MFPLNAKTVAELFSGNQILIYLAISVSCAVMLYFASIKFLLALQQGGYKGKRYFKWLANPYTPYLSRLMLLSFMAILFFCILAVCSNPIVKSTASSYVGFVSFLLFVGIYIDTENSVNAKIPLKKTRRLVRLCIVYLLVLTAVCFLVVCLVNYLAFIIGDEIFAILRYAVICVLPLLSPFILFLAYCVTYPFERLRYRHYVRLASLKIQSTDVIKIGITGSYGKTSVKEILRTILSQKYRVLSTPESYNTPMGVCITAKKLDSTHDVFLVEMGARNKGDIKELCNMVKPSIGVITGINSQHLESFGSIDNIKSTKFELIESLKDSGTAFFTSDCEEALDLYNDCKSEKYLAGLTEKDSLVYATDVKITKFGASFTLNVKGYEPVKCNTVLLAKHSISNICLACAVAYRLGLTPTEMALGINKITSVGHRLELIPNNKNIVIIDDSYNSNVNGVYSAMEVLDMFEGRKIVMTPGLVELGKEENRANLQLGRILAKHADIVIITGKQNAEMIINGLLDEGMNRENIIYAKSLKKGNEELNAIAKEGDVVLFENDLPDNYN